MRQMRSRRPAGRQQRKGMGMNKFQRTVIVLLAAIFAASIAVPALGFAYLRKDVVDAVLQEVTVANPVTEVTVTKAVAVTHPAFDRIADNTAPPEYARSYCADGDALWDIYEDYVYGPTVDRINEQMLLAQQWRNEVLAFCHR